MPALESFGSSGERATWAPRHPRLLGFVAVRRRDFVFRHFPAGYRRDLSVVEAKRRGGACFHQLHQVFGHPQAGSNHRLIRGQCRRSCSAAKIPCSLLGGTSRTHKIAKGPAAMSSDTRRGSIVR